MIKILLTGSNGMLGTDFINYFGSFFEIYPIDKGNGDITNIELLNSVIQNIEPDIILNFAAYTNVEDAEDVGKKDNFDVNALGVYNLAKLSAKYNKSFVTISTDYVFDGTGTGGYKEIDLPNPINNYGLSKYLGEKLAQQENPNSIIIRTSWLYGGGHQFKNFVNTMCNLGRNTHEVKVVSDQFGSPTYTIDLCQLIVNVLSDIDRYKGKILHASNSTSKKAISWFEFAEEIFRLIDAPAALVPCSSEEFITKESRPKYSKLLDTNNLCMRDWKEGLSHYIDRL